MTTVQAPPRTDRLAVPMVFAVGAAFATWAGRIPAVQDRLEPTPGTLGVAPLGLPVGATVALPLSGVPIARYGSRRTTRVAVTGLCQLGSRLPAAAR